MLDMTDFAAFGLCIHDDDPTTCCRCWDELTPLLEAERAAALRPRETRSHDPGDSRMTTTDPIESGGVVMPITS